MLRLYEETHVQNIADAIRNKNGTQNTYKISDMSSAINDISAASSGFPDTITAGDTPVIASDVMVNAIASTNMTATGIKVIIPKTGTYRFKFSCGRTNITDDWTTQLYKNGSAISDAVATWSSYQGYCTADVTCDSGDEIEIYARSRGINYRNIIGQLVACIDWNIFN